MRLRLAERLAAVGDAQGARAQYEAVSKAEPTSVDLWMKWAELERTYGTPEQASAVAKAALGGARPRQRPVPLARGGAVPVRQEMSPRRRDASTSWRR